MLENTLEVGWHGLVEKTGEHTFLLKDIIVYPQEVSAVSIIPDADEYAQWLMALDDETFPLVRYHGHSHVNMGITPSSIDTDFRDDITLHLKENDFYIFHIANKKNQHHIEIYDTTLNILYTPDDVEISIVLNDGTPVKIWQQETTKLVRTYTNQSVTQIPIIQQAIHDGYRPEDKTALTKLNKKEKERIPIMDLNKSREFFDPDNVKTSCQIIGCGAIGSTVAENLTRLGIKELTLWDSDIVASHNIANQMFRFNDIGSLKINALDDMLHDINPDIKINLRPEFVTKQPMSGFIFLCVDDIEVRKQIAENLRPNPYIKAMFDFRMRLLDAQHYATPWDNEKEKRNIH